MSISTKYIPANQKLERPQSQQNLLHTQINSSKLTKRKNLFQKIQDKRDDFTFSIVNLSYLCGNIPASLVYWTYVSQLFRYTRACLMHQDFLKREQLLSPKLLEQQYIQSRFKQSLLKFYVSHHELVDLYSISIFPIRVG